MVDEQMNYVAWFAYTQCLYPNYNRFVGPVAG